MPLYMEVHSGEGEVAVDAVVEAHRDDLRGQGPTKVRYLRYWVDEQRGQVFCLVEAPSAEAVEGAHRTTPEYGDVEVFQVQEAL